MLFCHHYTIADPSAFPHDAHKRCSFVRSDNTSYLCLLLHPLFHIDWRLETLTTRIPWRFSMLTPWKIRSRSVPSPPSITFTCTARVPFSSSTDISGFPVMLSAVIGSIRAHCTCRAQLCSDLYSLGIVIQRFKLYPLGCAPYFLKRWSAQINKGCGRKKYISKCHVFTIITFSFLPFLLLATTEKRLTTTSFFVTRIITWAVNGSPKTEPSPVPALRPFVSNQTMTDFPPEYPLLWAATDLNMYLLEGEENIYVSHAAV